MCQFFCSTCAPSFLLPERDLVNVKFSASHQRNNSQLINSEPLSESNPRIGKGKLAVASLIAANTHFCALFFTDLVSVQPVAISVISRVKQNSPEEFPPSWPTRSISTKPGLASSHSAQVRIGIESFNRVPGLV